MNRIFKETQKFNQWWLWLILFAAILFPLYFFANASSEDRKHLLVLTIVFLVEGVILLVFWMIQLRTEIDSKKISVHFYPFMRKTFLWNEVDSAKVVNYGFVGGWGIRFFTKYGTVFNIRGNKGLALKRKNGKKFLVGTQKEEELKKFLSSLQEKHHFV